MAINKVIYNGNTLMDVTDCDVTEVDVAKGKTFIKKNGDKAVGTSVGGGSSSGKLNEYFKKSITEVTTEDLDGLTVISENMFVKCVSLTSITIPDSVTTIGNYAFRNCSSLTEINIPEGVTRIGDRAFDDCSSLTSVHISDLTAWCHILFDGSSANPLYYAKNLYCNGTLVTELVIPDSVTSIKKYAFWGCSSLTSVTFAEGSNCTSIGDNAFTSCDSLTSVTISDSVASIGSSAFDGCSSLTSVTIPDSVTTIGSYAFSSCSSLTDVYYVGSKFSWDSIGIAGGNTYLTNATIHFVGKTESYTNVETRTESNSKGTTLYITTNTQA